MGDSDILHLAEMPGAFLFGRGLAHGDRRVETGKTEMWKCLHDRYAHNRVYKMTDECSKINGFANQKCRKENLPYRGGRETEKNRHAGYRV